MNCKFCITNTLFCCVQDGEDGDEAYAEKLRQSLRDRIDRNRGEFGDEGEQVGRLCVRVV